MFIVVLGQELRFQYHTRIRHKILAHSKHDENNSSHAKFYSIHIEFYLQRSKLSSEQCDYEQKVKN